MHTISSILADWYKLHQRPLPWRETNDAYAIWVSEVVLQQTRVDQGMEYYLRFMDRWPDVRALADAEEDEVLKMWQGLGYYSRARNLLSGARQVMQNFNGVVPERYEKLKTIKGIGAYTAAAVASIAFNEPVAVVDGNVARVIARLFAIEQPVNTPVGQRMILEVAEELLDRKNPGLHNQALMEFGALVCLPRNPQCHNCVLNHLCEARRLDKQKDLPLKANRKIIRDRWFNYLVINIQQNDKPPVLVVAKRNYDDIWKGMYEFPLIESKSKLNAEQLQALARPLLDALGHWQPLGVYHAAPHQLTHQRIMASFFEFNLKAAVDFNLPNGLSLANAEQFRAKPLPKLIETYLNNNSTQRID
ncbi:MAG TPA: A/G-specific adenine glycosylase [Bacteroidales bacterium]|nr:A/G-specific adenine glycosylase [Bacteroidales bacterium]